MPKEIPKLDLTANHETSVDSQSNLFTDLINEHESD